MSWQLALGYIKALVWPLVVLILGLVFRRQVGGLFGRIESLQTPVGSATFQKQAEAVGQELAEEQSALIGLVSEIDSENERQISEQGAPGDEEREVGDARVRVRASEILGDAPGSLNGWSEESEIPDSGISDSDAFAAEYRNNRSSRASFANLEILTVSDPTAAVLGAWREVEMALVDAQRDFFMGRNPNAPQVLNWLSGQGLLPTNIVRSAHDLRELRNRVVHEGEILLTTEGARTYVQSARKFIDALALARTPSLRARSYENSLQRSLSVVAREVVAYPAGRNIPVDFLVRDDAGRVAVVQAKYSQSPLTLVDVQQEIGRVVRSGIAGGILVITSVSLSEAVRDLNASETVPLPDGPRPVEIVTWAGPEDDDVLVRALGRVAREVEGS